MAIPVFGGKVHAMIDARRVIAQHRLDPALALEGLTPFQPRELPEAGDRVGDGDLVGGLPGLFPDDDVTERTTQLALQPALHRGQRDLLIVQMLGDLEGEMRARCGLLACQLSQDKEQLVGVAAGGGEQAVGPEVRTFALAQPLINLFGQPSKNVQQPDAQHQRNRPEFTDRQRRNRLIGRQEVIDIVAVEPAVGMLDQRRGKVVDPGFAHARLSREHRELMIILFRQVQPDVIDLTLYDVGIIEDPLRSG
ncbi:MAG: hypothetical protein NTX71_04050 [Candidatus Aureabacteria bacterium]|nr:hypothetical protein [Candidatus Auribacterota bacterium]